MSTEIVERPRTRVLREKRDGLGVTQKELAIRLKIKEGTLIDLERRGIPDLDAWDQAIDELAAEKQQRKVVTIT